MTTTGAKLRLEPLEARMMLATGGAPDLAEANPGLDLIVASQDVGVTVELYALDSILKVIGPGDGDLVINLDLLPQSVTRLIISSFTNVTLEGAATVKNLIVSDVDMLDAGRISLVGQDVGMRATNVDRIKIDVAPSMTILEGTQTLLEVNSFAKGSDGLQVLLSSLDKLGILIGSPIDALQIGSHGKPDQEIFLNRQPGRLMVGEGLNSLSQVQIVDGDFLGYFLAPPKEEPGEPATPEQPGNPADPDEPTEPGPSEEPVIRPAEATLVSLEALLRSAAVRAALINLNVTPALENVPQQAVQSYLPLLAGPELSVNSSPIVLESLDGESSPTVDVAFGQLPEMLGEFGGTNERLEARNAETLAHAAQTFSLTETLELSLPGLPAGATASERSLPEVMEQITEPIARMAVELGGLMTTFGQMASETLSGRFEPGQQTPLLIDGRPVRQTAERAVLTVLSI